MTTLRQVILYIVERQPGISDADLTKAIFNDVAKHQQVNAECRNCPEIDRRQGDTNIGNYIGSDERKEPTLRLVESCDTEVDAR